MKKMQCFLLIIHAVYSKLFRICCYRTFCPRSGELHSWLFGYQMAQWLNMKVCHCCPMDSNCTYDVNCLTLFLTSLELFFFNRFNVWISMDCGTHMIMEDAENEE